MLWLWTVHNVCHCFFAESSFTSPSRYGRFPATDGVIATPIVKTNTWVQQDTFLAGSKNNIIENVQIIWNCTNRNENESDSFKASKVEARIMVYPSSDMSQESGDSTSDIYVPSNFACHIFMMKTAISKRQ